MPRSHMPNAARIGLLFVVTALAVQGPATPAAAGTVVPVAPFRSVTLRGGGKVIVRHAATQQVTLLKGSTEHTRPVVVDGNMLLLKKCRGDCPERYELAVEILTPAVDDLMVIDGGMIECVGDFPPQDELGCVVRSGGAIDLRSLKAAAVVASVQHGGRIFTTPQKTLVAEVEQGGGITYWGDPQVRRSIQHGGVVGRGAAADASKPLHELGPTVPDVPPVPPVPPTPPARRRGSSL